MSKIYDRLTSMIMEATREHDRVKAQAWKNLKARLTEWKTSREGAKVLAENDGEIPETTEVTILQKMCSELKGDIVAYGSREDLVGEAEAELKVLESLLPDEPTDEEIRVAVSGWTGSFEKKNMKAIIDHVRQLLPGATGKAIARIVSEYERV